MSRTIGEFGMTSIPCSAPSDIDRMPMMNVFGIERLARVVGRTRLLATTAFGAGESVEQVLPAEVLERLEPERRVLVLDVELGQLTARGELPVVDVDEARVDVEVLVRRDEQQERGEDDDVAPPQDDEPGLEHRSRQRPQRHRDGVGREGARDVAVRRRLEGLGEELGRDDQEDHQQDEQPGPAQRQTGWPVEEPALGHVGERDVDADGHEVLDRDEQDPDRPVERARGDPLDEAAGDDIDVPDQQDRRAEDCLHEALCRGRGGDDDERALLEQVQRPRALADEVRRRPQPRVPAHAAARQERDALRPEVPRRGFGEIARIRVLGNEDRQRAPQLLVQRGDDERQSRLRHTRARRKRLRELLQLLVLQQLAHEGEQDGALFDIPDHEA